MDTFRYYLDMDSFYSMACRLPVAPIVLNATGIVISVPRVEQTKRVKKWMNALDVGELDYPMITVTSNQRAEFSDIMKSIYFVVKRLSVEEARPFMVDGVLFTARPGDIPELRDRAAEVTDLSFTIGCGASINTAIKSCIRLKALRSKHDPWSAEERMKYVGKG